MSMEGLDVQRKRRRVEVEAEEASPSQETGYSSATEGEQQPQSTATDETRKQKSGGEGIERDRVEQEGAPLLNNREEEEDGDEEENYGNGKKNEEFFSINSTRPSAVGPTKGEMDAACAKWSRMLDDGSCQWDHTKLKCLLSQDERDDVLLMRNLVHGTIVSGQLYPLIFETSSEEDNEMVRLRSLSFFEQLLADEENGVSKYQSLSSEQRVIVAVGVRDLFLGAWHGILSERERFILEGMVKVVDETVGCIEVMGMNISFHPSANFKVVKLIEGLDDALGDGWSPLFAQAMHAPKLFAVFVDPAELSFHNFENIIPLDRWVEWKLEGERDGELSLSLADVHQVQVDREVFTCKLGGAACHMLKQLSSLGLYVTPLNKAARGGERFIFHSALLCKALSEAVRSSEVLSTLAQGRLASSFAFVNYVFRCNKFAPGDAMFASHLDTPYYDSTLSQVSKYTLLIYLTAGHSEPALRVGDVELNEIEEMTCVIFDQNDEHEGRPFIESEKIFIRTELVFKDEHLGHNNQIASLFSEACYMTGQSVLDEGLASYAHECFERANLLHWAIERGVTQPPVYLHKNFQEMHFMTNGHNYWFAKDSGVDVVDCGTVAVLDYLNCKVDGKPFRSLCPTTTVRNQFANLEDIWVSLANSKEEKAKALRRLKKTDIESLIKKYPGRGIFKPVNALVEVHEDDDSYEYVEGHTCCRGHRGDAFDALKSPEVRRYYKNCCNDTRRKLFRVPLLMLNQEIVINESNVKIVGDKMFFLQEPNGKPLPRINFAACWGGDPPEFIDIDGEISAPQLLIPPIMFQKFDQGYHLMLDFFRNDWMVQVDDEHKIPVPIISNELMEGETPFLNASKVELDSQLDLRQVRIGPLAVAQTAAGLQTEEDYGDIDREFSLLSDLSTYTR